MNEQWVRSDWAEKSALMADFGRAPSVRLVGE